jgi:hypothetical protein
MCGSASDNMPGPTSSAALSSFARAAAALLTAASAVNSARVSSASRAVADGLLRRRPAILGAQDGPTASGTRVRPRQPPLATPLLAERLIHVHVHPILLWWFPAREPSSSRSHLAASLKSSITARSLLSVAASFTRHAQPQRVQALATSPRRQLRRHCRRVGWRRTVRMGFTYNLPVPEANVTNCVVSPLFEERLPMLQP